jgi:esterase/lipase
MKTAIEWLVDYIKNLEKYPYKTIQELEEQAKEMEKEQNNTTTKHLNKSKCKFGLQNPLTYI